MQEQRIGFHHIALRVSDYEASKKFYVERFGADC